MYQVNHRTWSLTRGWEGPGVVGLSHFCLGLESGRGRVLRKVGTWSPKSRFYVCYIREKS